MTTPAEIPSNTSIDPVHEAMLTGAIQPRPLPSWGINLGDWSWPARQKILFVTDAHIDRTHDPLAFGLGQVLATLRGSSPWWFDFHVDVAKRDGEPIVHEIGGSWFPWQQSPEWKLYEGFRFTRAGFDIDIYDQVWFFGYHPGDLRDDDENILNEEFSPLDDAELKLLAEWMDRGGGVFASGDHGTLGASMCSRIPRVRSMRKWKHDQTVPAREGASRHETLVHAPNTSTDAKEGDRWPQQIEPVYRLVANGGGPRPWPFINPLASRVSHPLLCGPNGVIDRFPDHMHEGEVIEDGAIELDRPLDIPGYVGREYPLPEPVVVAAGAGFAGFPIDRPSPQVIAYGRTTNAQQTSVKRFPLIGVYDGDRAAIGRVVVDSTWHHWFSMNLVGFQADAPFLYQNMQAYFRNVALWLASPGQRASMLLSATWGALTGLSPMAFHRRMGPWEIGDRVIEVLEQSTSRCIVSELVATFLEPDTRPFSVPPDLPPGAPCWSCLPVEMVNRSIVGGIGSGLLDLALDYRDAHGMGKHPRLDPDAIRRLGMRGAAEGYRMLGATLDDAAADLAAVRDRLADRFRTLPVNSVPVPVEVAGLRIIADRLQMPDGSDPALMDGYITFTVRAKLGGSVVASETIERIQLPEFDRGIVIDLARDLRIVAQSGESLTVEVLVGEWKGEEAASKAVRFVETLDGDPSTWMGPHAPGVSQRWRLWYRIEKSSEQST
jgi:hypothetical protein